ncbi:MAG: MoxR family ATPase [Bacteroidales bacterium]|nr:MoxR family ATPase [Bacteroidales bacterium]
MNQNVDIRALNAKIEANSGFVTMLMDGMARTIVGQQHLSEALLIGLLSDGHILLEGVPGLAKTLAIRTLASLISADFGRIQFTPDLLPADVVGTMVYSRKDDSFNVRRGPVFANFVLADEINRAPAKVQSALLQAMQEREVTLGDETMRLPELFLVMATQNPIEQEGTYQLPEAQTDRFMLKVIVDYPTLEEEKRIVRASMAGNIADKQVMPVVDVKTILNAREMVKEVYLDERIEQYVADIVFATRFPEKYKLEHLKPYIAFGGSPRASISLALAARSLAFIRRRGYVVPDDVRGVAFDVLRHRIGLTYEAEAAEMTTDKIISEILAKVEVP